MTDAASVIRARADKVVVSVLADDIGFSEMVKQMVAHTVKEYRGRFLHELIQNGYDAHKPGTTSGRIAIHFHDTEDEFGVLYVANGGEPLSKSNFDGMASLGRSDKPIGVGIGNKGVGFKSVFQICEVPQVFSARDQDDLTFDGFSFRFGTRDDLLDLLNGDEERTDEIAEKLSLSLLTVPLDTVPEQVQALRREGYVTVLRLPANSTRAAEEIIERIERLLNADSPIMLFLERLQTLSISPSVAAGRTQLTRRQIDSDDFSRVILNENETYRFLQKQVPPERLRAALQASVDEGALDQQWLKWNADAQVSIAIGDGVAADNGHAFTYLPMGEDAKSPFTGHMNAPFITDFARVGLDREQPVNRLLLSCVAELCMESAASVIQCDSDANSVVDLVAWSSDLELLRETCESTYGLALEEFVRIPDLRGEWTPLAAVRRWGWPQTTAIDAASVAAGTDAHIIDPQRLDPVRMLSASQFALKLGTSLTPDSDQLAAWVESIAAGMLAAGTDTERWANFYDELDEIFDGGEALAGKRILLTADRTLAPCNEKSEADPGGTRRRRRRRRSAFFSPRGASDRDAAEDVSDDSLQPEGNADDEADAVFRIRPPRSLEDRIAFMHPELSWYDGPNRRPGRVFLENERLVQPFRTERLLALLGQVMDSSTSDRIQRDALEFAFRLFANNPDRHARELATVGLRVPTQQGEWIDAARARFGDPWSAEGAADLSALAAAASDLTPELNNLRSLLIASPSALPSGSSTASDTAKWAAFLKILGVSDKLPVLDAPDARSFQGRHLVAENIGGDRVPEQIPRGVVEQWIEGVQTTGNHHHPETKFQSNDLWHWFLGQHEVQLLPGRLRSCYARLVVRTLPTLKREHWESVWKRQQPRGIDTRVPTPLACFVRLQPWVPSVKPNETALEFSPPDECWLVSPEDQMAATYAPLVEPRLRRLIESLPAFAQGIGRLDMLIWGSPKHAAMLISFLTDLFYAGEIVESAAEHFRSSLSHAWAQVGDPDVPASPSLQEGLLVDRAGRIELLPPEDAGKERVFVVGVADQSATTRLVRELGWPVVTVDTDDIARLREVARTSLGPFWHKDVKVAADWEVEVRADGEAWLPSDAGERLCVEVPWLPLVVACTMRFPRTPGTRIGRQLERILDELGRIRLVRCTDISVATPSGPQPLPRRLRGVLPVPGEHPTLLVEQMGTPLTWGQLGTVAEAALELVRQTRFTAELLLSIGRLAPSEDAKLYPPDPAEIADVLGIPILHVVETETRVFSSAAGLVARVRPSAVCLVGEAALDALADDMIQTREDLHHALTELFIGDTPRAAELIDAAVDSPDANALRRRLSIPLSQYNDVLARCFPGSRTISNAAEQLEDFNLRRSQRRTELISWARERRYPAFQAGKNQYDWAEIRDLGFLMPADAWATTLDDLDEATIDGRIDEQMEQKFGPRPLSPVLDDWNHVREGNGRPLRERLVHIEQLVSAWTRKQTTGEASATAVVTRGNEFAENAWTALERIGALEFVILDDKSLAMSLDRVGLWPSGMPRSTTLTELGLSQDDVTKMASAQDTAREAKLRADRQVTVHGEVMDLELDMAAFVARIEAHLQTTPASLNTPYRSTNLQLLDETSQDKKPPSTRPGKSQAPTRLSDAQRMAIGLAGEVTAFHWLKAKDPSPVDETCWKSTNVSLAFVGAIGDDSLGYDFEVPRRHGSVMYEVKATTGDAGTIELGESEVVCAQEFARSDRWRLLIVEDVLSIQPRVLMLPNPFRRDSRAKFRFVGNSVRLRFRL